MNDLRNEIERQSAALESLVEFRRIFFTDKNDAAPAAFHHRWSDVLLNGTAHMAVEAFRESAKTQIVIRANLLHAIAYPQEHRSYIVIICATQTAASKKLREASRTIEADMKRDSEKRELSAMIEKIVEDSGNALEIHMTDGVKVRIEAYGKGAAVRGLSWGSKRPDIVIIDDPQDTEDARSETVTQNDWEWFLSDVIFLGQDSRIFLIGNNLGESCIVERVIKDADKLGFSTERIPIMDAVGRSAWPEKFPVDEIVAEMENFAALGEKHIWWREKMCEAIEPGSQRFKREYFRYFTHELPIDDMNIYTAADLASSKKDHADRTAIVTVGVKPDGHWFVLDVAAGRFDPSETMDAIFKAVSKWRPQAVGIESVAYQAALAHFLEKEMPRRNSFFVIEPLTAEKKKELRIDALQPRFKTGTVWFRQYAEWLKLLEGELLSFPKGLHDDVIDALAYVEQMAVIPVSGHGAGTAESVYDEDYSPFAWK